MDKSGIYKLTNKFNGRFYIGSTNCIRKRKSSHFTQLLHGKHQNPFLQNDYNKCFKEHDENPFVFEVVEECAVEQLLVREQWWLDTYCLGNNMSYNICPVAGGVQGRKHSPETIEKIRKANKGRKPAPQTIEAVRRAKLGKTTSDAQKAAVRTIWAGKKRPKTAQQVAKWKETYSKRTPEQDAERLLKFRETLRRKRELSTGNESSS